MVNLIHVHKIAVADTKRRVSDSLGFGMSVSYMARSPKYLNFEATRADSLTELAAEVDVLVVAVPGGPETRHSINAAVLEAMRPTAHLINISRGEVIDEAALILALQVGQIAGAGCL